MCNYYIRRVPLYPIVHIVSCIIYIGGGFGGNRSFDNRGGNGRGGNWDSGVSLSLALSLCVYLLVYSLLVCACVCKCVI